MQRTSTQVLADPEEITTAYHDVVGTGREFGVDVPVMSGFEEDLASSLRCGHELWASLMRAVHPRLRHDHHAGLAGPGEWAASRLERLPVRCVLTTDSLTRDQSLMPALQVEPVAPLLPTPSAACTTISRWGTCLVRT